jgi:hypothetical protein
MTVLDSLFFTLGLDVTGLKKGQKEAQESLKKTGDTAIKTQKELDESAKRTGESYKKLSDGVLEFGAILATAIGGHEFLQYITKTDTAVGNLSNNIGSTVKQVSTLEGVFRVMGSTTADAEGYLRNTNRILTEIKLKGGSDALNPLAMAGLNITAFRDAHSELERMQMLQQTARRLTPQEAQSRLQAAGYSEATINIILQQRKALADLFAEQEKMNSLSQRDIDLAFDRQHAWGTLTETLESFGRTAANTVSPALTTANVKTVEFLGYLKNDGPTAVAVTAGIGGMMLKMAGASGIAGSAIGGLVGKLGLYIAAAASLYEIIRLIDAGGQLITIKTRDGVTLTPEAQARMDAGVLNGLPDPFHSGGAGAGIVSGPNPYAALEQAQGLPPGVMAALKQEETGKGSGIGAVSPKGARGPFQFMGPTAAQYGVTNPDDPQQAALGASKYLGYLYRLYGGDMRRTLAAYNEGEGNVAKGNMPAETQKYVSDIMGRMGGSAAGHSTTTITTGPVTIATQATDGKGIMRDLAGGLNKMALANQAQTGVN